MSKEIKAPIHKEIPLRPFLEKLIDGTITKDLCDGEEICPTCGGFGLEIRNNPYGLGEHAKPMFPYKHQSLVMCTCPTCYNGVVNRCKLCGELIRRGWLKHDCEQQRALDRAEASRKEREEFDKAPIAPPEIESNCHMFFSDWYNDGFFSDWDDFFEEWWDEDKDKECPQRPEFVWITEEDKFYIDARTICEFATENLYDDAYDHISDNDFDRLQAFLDKWCASTGVGQSAHVSHKYKVRIPWEKYIPEGYE